MERTKLPPPIGAIWIRGNRVRNNLVRVVKEKFETHNITITTNEVESFIVEALVPHTLTVKVNTYLDESTGERKEMKEKYIAIENHSKRRNTQPDYFLHTYQTHTGAAPEAPWGNQTSHHQVDKVEVVGKNDNVSTSGQKHDEETRLEI